jgi:hypothetical protein
VNASPQVESQPAVQTSAGPGTNQSSGSANQTYSSSTHNSSANLPPADPSIGGASGNNTGRPLPAANPPPTTLWDKTVRRFASSPVEGYSSLDDVPPQRLVQEMIGHNLLDIKQPKVGKTVNDLSPSKNNPLGDGRTTPKGVNADRVIPKEWEGYSWEQINKFRAGTWGVSQVGYKNNLNNPIATYQQVVDQIASKEGLPKIPTELVEQLKKADMKLLGTLAPDGVPNNRIGKVVAEGSRTLVQNEDLDLHEAWNPIKQKDSTKGKIRYEKNVNEARKYLKVPNISEKTIDTWYKTHLKQIQGWMGNVGFEGPTGRGHPRGMNAGINLDGKYYKRNDPINEPLVNVYDGNILKKEAETIDWGPSGSSLDSIPVTQYDVDILKKWVKSDYYERMSR